MLCRSPSLADDLVQGACERALANADSWTPGTRFDAFGCSVSSGTIGSTTSDGRKSEGMAEDITTHTQLIGDPGEGPILSRLVLSEVQRAIDSLPLDQREVLVLVCGEDLTYREVFLQTFFTFPSAR